jgi:hypothetical protein
MTLSVRSSNIHKKNNIDLLQQILRRVEAHIHNPEIGYNLDHDSIRYELDAVKEVSYY